MGMKINNVDTAKLLPAFMQNDPADASLGEAASELIRALGERIPRLREWDMIDEMTDAELDEKAWESNIGWYDSSMPLEYKRNTVKQAALLKEKAGTRWAVEEAVKAGYGATPEIREWFEYGGAPGTFRLVLAATNMFDFAKVYRAIEYVKRKSQHAESITMLATEDSGLYYGVGKVVVSECRIPCEAYS